MNAREKYLGEHCEPARKTIQLKWWLCLIVLELAATSTKLSHFQQDIVLCIFVCFVKPVFTSDVIQGTEA